MTVSWLGQSVVLSDVVKDFVQLQQPVVGSAEGHSLTCRGFRGVVSGPLSGVRDDT